jgi:hypothetical protein
MSFSARIADSRVTARVEDPSGVARETAGCY